MAAEKNNRVVVEHEFAAPVAKVFGALKEGRLFFNCGAWPEKTQIDFRPGGKYRLDFAHYGKTYGEFTEIVENKLVAFTWNSDEMEIKDTKVSIELSPSAKGCKVILYHEGFSDLETAKSHEGGWNSGLSGTDQELTKFRVHLEREFLTPVEKLYEACTRGNFLAYLGFAQENSKIDFQVGGQFSGQREKEEIGGEFVEIEKDKKIVFTWKASHSGEKPNPSTKVLMEFGPWGDEEKNSFLELSHEGLTSEKAALSHHDRWNRAFWNLYKKVGR